MWFTQPKMLNIQIFTDKGSQVCALPSGIEKESSVKGINMHCLGLHSDQYNCSAEFKFSRHIKLAVCKYLTQPYTIPPRLSHGTTPIMLQCYFMIVLCFQTSDLPIWFQAQGHFTFHRTMYFPFPLLGALFLDSRTASFFSVQVTIQTLVFRRRPPSPIASHHFCFFILMQQLSLKLSYSLLTSE